MRLLRFLSLITLPIVLLFTASIALIHAQPFDNQTLRSIMQPADCAAPCFMGIQPGITQMREASKLLDANLWVGHISSYIDSGCCSIAMKWNWNGKQPPELENGDNTVYFDYNAQTGIQTVENIAIHTRISTGYAILLLGAWQASDSGALKGLNNAYVEAFYPQESVHVVMMMDCPITRWRLWQTPLTVTMSRHAWSPTGMKPITEAC